MSSLDLSSFGELTVEDLEALCVAAESTERYEDMVLFISALVTKVCPKKDLNQRQRTFLATAFKRVTSSHRNAWRAAKHEAQTKESAVIFQKRIEKDLLFTCKNALHLLTNYLLKAGDIDAEARIFYLKMIADNHRYLSEISAIGRHGAKAIKSYEKAWPEAQKLDATSPLKLGLALNFSVCLMSSTENDSNRALEIAKQTFEEAVKDLETLSEKIYKESTLILQLLKENIDLWEEV